MKFSSVTNEKLSDKVISQIMSNAVLEEYSSMNPFGSKKGEWVSFSAVTESGRNRNEVGCSISLDRLPVSVKNEIEKIKKDV